VVEQLVQELERAYDVQKERKEKGMELIFAKFDSKRALWASAAQATALLDALGALAQTAAKNGFTRPRILDCPPGESPCVNIVQGRHPCVENTFSSSEFIPNDVSLGRSMANESAPPSRVLLLSGPNMGVSFCLECAEQPCHHFFALTLGVYLLVYNRGKVLCFVKRASSPFSRNSGALCQRTIAS